MKKSELLEYLSEKFPHIDRSTLSEILNGTFEAMTKALANGEKIEIRGLGSFRVKERDGRTARNPKTGELVQVPPKKIVHFKMGKILKAKLFSKKVP
ncbi:MAG: integration host factor subunit beta [Aquificota bacterium]|nr:MAG: integration host factor subunit beta [Aquificota bacterium]